ncbi:hypothetical protein J6590_021312 [Homalodisca vitripennis]|nr:hypothetical protein J6590_021312 [Homalodisca vitripennis]
MSSIRKIGVKNRLTDLDIDKFPTYYGLAIRRAALLKLERTANISKSCQTAKPPRIAYAQKGADSWGEIEHSFPKSPAARYMCNNVASEDDAISRQAP